jgi:hypothetical protein
MSTYWYFECASHEPPIRSDDEFTQHTDDDAFRTALGLARMRPIGQDQEGDDYFSRRAIWFLKQHPACELAIVSEYGERRSGDYLLGPRK